MTDPRSLIILLASFGGVFSSIDPPDDNPFHFNLSNLLYEGNRVTLVDCTELGVQDFYEGLLKNLNLPFTSYDVSNENDTRFMEMLVHRQIVFIIFDNYESMVKFEKERRVKPFEVSLQSLFIVVMGGSSIDQVNCVENYESSISQLASMIFDRIWNGYKILNMLIYFPHLCNRQTVLKYDPISLEFPRAKLVRQDELDSNPRVLLLDYKKLNGFPLVARVFARMPTMVQNLSASFLDTYLKRDIQDIGHLGGIDAFILANMAKALNFTPIVGPSSDGVEFGNKLPNNTFTGSLGDVITRRADISFNGRFVKYYSTDDIEFTVPVYHDQLCVLVPKALRIPTWRNIFLAFRTTTWYMILLTTFAAGILWCFMKIASFRLYNIKSYPCCINFMEICLMIASQPIFLPTVTRERIFVAGCLVFSTIFAGVFQGYLNTAFSTISHYPDINSLQDLDESGFYIGSSSGLDDIFGADISALMDNLQKKTKYSSTPAIDLAAFERSIASVERRLDARIKIEINYLGDDGRPLLHIVNECPRSYYFSYIVYKGYPFLPYVNRFIRRIIEAGLNEWWYMVTVESIMLNHRSTKKSSDESWKMLSMVDVQTAFFALIIGLVISFVVFLAETGYFHFKCKKILKRRNVGVFAAQM